MDIIKCTAKNKEEGEVERIIEQAEEQRVAFVISLAAKDFQFP